MAKRQITNEEAQASAGQIGLNFTEAKFDLDQLRRGMTVELEHGTVEPRTNVTNDDLAMTAKIAWAHLLEYPDYYDRLDKLEAEAEAFWAGK
jgi:hypothetical protein